MFPSEYMPNGQDAQVDELFAASATLSVPGGHEMQVDKLDPPGLVEYVPGGHREHDDRSFAPTTGEYLPAGQSEHTVAPVALLYDPASHGLQASTVSPS